MSGPITAVWPGRPYPRGATWDGEGVNFALFSEHAEKVELCIFDPGGRRELQRIEVKERTDEMWHCYLPEARPGLVYGYRVYGAYDPGQGLRFNPNVVLLDPYAKAAVSREGPGIVLDAAWIGEGDRSFRTPAWQDLVIAEAHVRDLVAKAPGALTAEERLRVRIIVDYMKPAHTHFRVVEPVIPEVIDHLELGLSELGETWLLH